MSTSVHGRPKVQHINVDKYAHCGGGCAGNPYDQTWDLGPLKWGETHEIGQHPNGRQQRAGRQQRGKRVALRRSGRRRALMATPLCTKYILHCMGRRRRPLSAPQHEPPRRLHHLEEAIALRVAHAAVDGEADEGLALLGTGRAEDAAEKTPRAAAKSRSAPVVAASPVTICRISGCPLSWRRS